MAKSLNGKYSAGAKGRAGGLLGGGQGPSGWPIMKRKRGRQNDSGQNRWEGDAPRGVWEWWPLGVVLAIAERGRLIANWPSEVLATSAASEPDPLPAPVSMILFPMILPLMILPFSDMPWSGDLGERRSEQHTQRERRAE